ncbi:hypothetical protein SAMN04488564_104475 [Lentzea waywayandensis]|uniref:Flagellar basal body-associated protein FliL n=1 Tax=Lentzea waywayandensis TaxID=84724 RepID=A0A1I6EHB2_9PSEU|nr:hypothetical protein [Lentzea waywayandensis]SFR16938.1 hypothetical protein SAMN04488564_104475 [Lentzea waywayandensis]
MSWQDELQKLDAELASGRVSADEYRQRRDAILAGNTGGQQDGGSLAPPARWQTMPPPEKTQYIKPVTGPQPVQQAPQQNAPQQNSDKTQVVSVNGGGHNPDATQVVPGSGGFPQPNYGQPQQFAQGGGWQGGQGGQAGAPPPWLSGDQDSFAQPSWNQGPEVFDSAGKSSGKGKKIVGIVIIVLLVAGLGVGGYFFFTSKKDNQAQPPVGQSSTPATPTVKPLPDPPAQKPDAGTTTDSVFGPLPGTERPGGGQFDLPKMAAQKLLVGKTTDALIAGGMTEATLSTTIDGKNTLSIIVMAVSDQAAASKVVAGYLEDQAALKENKDLAYKGVKVVTDPAKKVLRGVYVYYNKAIVVEVFTSEGSAAETQFKQLLKDQLDFAPPTVR